jgi:hypothetical protein
MGGSRVILDSMEKKNSLSTAGNRPPVLDSPVCSLMTIVTELSRIPTYGKLLRSYDKTKICTQKENYVGIASSTEFSSRANYLIPRSGILLEKKKIMSQLIKKLFQHFFEPAAISKCSQRTKTTLVYASLRSLFNIHFNIILAVYIKEFLLVFSLRIQTTTLNAFLSFLMHATKITLC